MMKKVSQSLYTIRTFYRRWQSCWRSEWAARFLSRGSMCCSRCTHRSSGLCRAAQHKGGLMRISWQEMMSCVILPSNCALHTFLALMNLHTIKLMT